MICEMCDPHPGRCPNLRPSRDAYGYPAHLRCLELAAETHVCRFPDPPTLYPAVSNTYTVPTPKPWVRPETVC